MIRACIFVAWAVVTLSPRLLLGSMSHSLTLTVLFSPPLIARMVANKTNSTMEIAHTELKSVPEWFEEKMLRNDTKSQAQPDKTPTRNILQR